MSRVPSLHPLGSFLPLRLLVLLQLLLGATALADDLELHQLSVVFRHGDRTPETFPRKFPNDPNMFNSFYPMGSGGLTNQGKEREYALGKLLRQRYGDFLGRDYLDDRVFAVSSDTPRTKMSLLLVLAALYPPSLSSQGKWNEDLNWQPIPYQYHDFTADYIFNRDKCETFIEEFEKVYTSAEVQRQLKKFKTYSEQLRNATGKKAPVTLLDALLLHNNLDIERRLNLTMEPWMLRELQDDRLADMRRMLLKLEGYNPKLRRLDGGYLLRLLREGMLGAIGSGNETRGKLSLYSGHDKTIIRLLRSLDLYDWHFPEFGSALIFELLSKNDEYFVKVSYYLGIPEETVDLVVPGCPASLCPLEKYLAATRAAEALDDELPCVIHTISYFSED